MQIRKAISVLGLATTLVLSSAVAKDCDGKPVPKPTCSISARDSTSISVGCSDGTTYNVDAPSDLYPKCQVGQPWEGCKW